MERQVYGFWWEELKGGKPEWPENPLFRFYLWRRSLDPRWPARVWNNLYPTQSIPPWLMRYDGQVESERTKCARKIALVGQTLLA